jgi:hypothetical protein
MDAEYLSLAKPPAAAGKKPQQRSLGLQPVKLKPKRGRSTRKQKRRLAAKLDKVKPQRCHPGHYTHAQLFAWKGMLRYGVLLRQAMAVADRKAAKNTKRTAQSALRQSSKSLWGAKAKALLDQADVS